MAVKNLVALKVIVGIDPENGQAKYPNFNLISSAARKGMDWSKYIDVHGTGWHYDKTSGHKEETAESPQGQQFACLCVPQDFADEALAMFPSVVSEQTELEFEDFHDNKAHAHEPSETISTEVLNGLSAQRTLMVTIGQDVTALDAKIAKALDPTDKTEQGVIENKGKVWKDAKSIQNVILKNPGMKV
jgi:hypothetical protein